MRRAAGQWDRVAPSCTGKREPRQQETGTNPGLHVSDDDLGGLFGSQSLDAGVQAALVTGGGVGVEDTLLDALIEGGGSRLVLLAGGLYVAGVEGLTQQAEAAADAALVRTVNRSAPFS